MSPIKGLSESVRLPRLGRIRIGIKVKNEKGIEHPQKTDYFVLPQDHPDYKQMVEMYGEKPKELRILIPVEDEEQWCEQYYRCYNLTYGLVCKGDGETATRMVYAATGEMPKAQVAGTVKMIDLPCPGPECPVYLNKEKGKPQCNTVMNLRFMLPEVAGLGVWQIDTGSKNSILNINSCADIIKRAFGRISLIPLKLTVEPIQVNNPETGKKQTVYALNLRSEVTIAQLAEAGRKQTQIFRIEAPDLTAAYDLQVETDIEELWDGLESAGTVDTVTGEITELEPQPEAVPDAPQATEKPVKAEAGQKVQAEPIANLGDLFTRAKKLPKPVSRDELVAALNLNNHTEITPDMYEAAWTMAQQISGSKLV